MATASSGYVNIARRQPDIGDYADMIRRRRTWILGPAFAGLVLGVVVAFWWPDTYVSEAVLSVTPPQVNQKLVPTDLSTQMAERLNQMQQLILSRSSLTGLILDPKLDLYKRERGRKSIDQLVELMRKNIHITVPPREPGEDQPRMSSFRIAFGYPDRHKAQAVVGALVNKFTNGNFVVEEQQGKLTSSFLGDQYQAARQNMDRIERAMADFRSANTGRLPEQVNVNIQAMNALQTQQAALTEALARNSQDKLMLEAQLQTYKNQLNSMTAGGEESGSVQKNERIAELDKVILDTETSLEAMRQVYKDDHPDVRSYKARLETLRKQRDALEKAEQSSAAAAKPKRQNNPQAAKAEDDVKSSIFSIQNQIRLKDVDTQERQRQLARLAKAMRKYQARIDAGPLVEQKYGALNRDYQLARAKYDEIIQKKNLADTASALRERKGGENLEILDPPSLPEQPAEPHRPVIIGAGTGAGLLLGILLAAFKELKDTSLKNLKDIRAYTSMPVLSSIPLLENAGVARQRRRMFLFRWVTAMILGLVAMSGSMYHYYFGRS
jgi:succinoglycan biosynthesis transport protein ExoP